MLAGVHIEARRSEDLQLRLDTAVYLLCPALRKDGFLFLRPAMAMIATHAARLKPEIRLAEAISQFEASLSADDKAVFCDHRAKALECPPDTADVMQFTALIDRQLSNKAGRCLGPRYTNFMQGVQQFAALRDVIIGGSQNIIACGVWSLVRMSILVCRLAQKSRDRGTCLPLTTQEQSSLIYDRIEYCQFLFSTREVLFGVYGDWTISSTSSANGTAICTIAATPSTYPRIFYRGCSLLPQSLDLYKEVYYSTNHLSLE